MHSAFHKLKTRRLQSRSVEPSALQLPRSLSRIRIRMALHILRRAVNKCAVGNLRAYHIPHHFEPSISGFSGVVPRTPETFTEMSQNYNCFVHSKAVTVRFNCIPTDVTGIVRRHGECARQQERFQPTAYTLIIRTSN
jgi:hypothetical protein